MLVTVFEGHHKASFSIATTPRCRGGHYSFLRIAPLYPWYVLSFKQGGIQYYFYSLWYDATWDWTQVSRSIGEHSTQQCRNGDSPVNKREHNSMTEDRTCFEATVQRFSYYVTGNIPIFSLYKKNVRSNDDSRLFTKEKIFFNRRKSV